MCVTLSLSAYAQNTGSATGAPVFATDVLNDNKSGLGSIKLSWNLQ